MSGLRSMPALAVAVWLSGAALANVLPPEGAAVPPEVGLQRIYENLAAKFEGCSTYTTAHATLYDFTPELLVEYKKAVSAPEPIIDGDVFYDAQDGEPSAVAVKALTQEGADRATVQADFTVSGEPRKLVFSLKLNGEAWEIDDIAYGDGRTLRGLISEGLKATAAPAP